jgi:hypothetical protein
MFWQVAVRVLAIGFQYLTIRSQTRADTATPPYLWAVPLPNQRVWPLTPEGAAHATLRGLDAAMALGLVATIAAAWARKTKRSAARRLGSTSFLPGPDWPRRSAALSSMRSSGAEWPLLTNLEESALRGLSQSYALPSPHDSPRIPDSCPPPKGPDARRSRRRRGPK